MSDSFLHINFVIIGYQKQSSCWLDLPKIYIKYHKRKIHRTKQVATDNALSHNAILSEWKHRRLLQIIAGISYTITEHPDFE